MPEVESTVPYWAAHSTPATLLDEADRPGQHEHRRFVFKPELVARASSGFLSPGQPVPA